MIVRPTGRHVPGFRQQARAAVLRDDTTSKLVLLALVALALSACENIGVHDAQSLLMPRFQRSEVFGVIAGFGTTFAALPDLIAMLRRQSIAGMNPRMAGIMGVFQVLWVYYGLLILSRPVIIWNVVAILINFLSVGAYVYFRNQERQRTASVTVEG